MKKYNLPIRTANDYITAQGKEFQKTLNKLREIVIATVPKAEETISYQVICYKHHYMLVGIGVKKGHCSFYSMSPQLLKNMQSELAHIKYSGSTIHFPVEEELPEKLIKKIILKRVAENEDRAAKRKKK